LGFGPKRALFHRNNQKNAEYQRMQFQCVGNPWDDAVGAKLAPVELLSIGGVDRTLQASGRVLPVSHQLDDLPPLAAPAAGTHRPGTQSPSPPLPRRPPPTQTGRPSSLEFNEISQLAWELFPQCKD
jgi:hypothetical protein